LWLLLAREFQDPGSRIQDPLDKRENGEDAKKDHLNYLELLAHQHLREELMEDKLLDVQDKLLDVQDFESEERDKEVVGKASSKDKASYGSEDDDR
jgi:hypothetical protein